MSEQRMSREAVIDSFKSDPESWISKSRENRVSVAEQLQFEAPAKSNSWNHPLVAKDVLARDGLRIYPVGRKGSSKVSTFKNNYQQALLMDSLEDIYQLSFSGNNGRRSYRYEDERDRMQAEKLHRKEERQLAIVELADSATTIRGFTENTPWRPYAEGDFDYDAYEPEIPYADLCMTVDVMEEMDKRIADYNIDGDSEMMVPTPEGTDPPTITLDFDSRTATMNRWAIGISVGQSVVNSSNPVLASGMARAIRNIGLRYDERVSYLFIKEIVDNSGTAISLSLSGRNILEMQCSFRDGKRADRVVGAKRPILDYVDALRKAYQLNSGADFLSYPMLGNMMSRPEKAYYATNHSDAGIPNAETLYWFDSMNTLARLEYMYGEYDMTKFDAGMATHTRYFARWIGYYLQKDAPIVAYDVV